MAVGTHAASYDDAVFINCPFDLAYQPLFHALVFTVQDCGFLARCALEADDSGEERIAKIKRIVAECRHGIHDISRTDLDDATKLPRFNMPLELGLFLGAREFGGRKQKLKRMLVLDREHYRYRSYLSDIAGQDIRAHDGDPIRAIRVVRDWLGNFRTSADPSIILPGAPKIISRYHEFQAELPTLCDRLHLELEALQFVELRTIVQEWVEAAKL
ncbi:hypothetical protein BH23GEM7_BH23GEM7_16400 [soil metagenome]